MSALLVRLRTDLRLGWRTLASLALIAGLFGGLVLGSFAAARRTRSAVPRLLASSWYGQGEVEAEPSLWPQIAALPTVRDIGRGAYVLVGAVGPDSKPLLPLGSVNAIAIVDAHVASGTMVLRGRMFDPARADEIVINENAARLLDARVGSVLANAGFSFEQMDAVFRGEPVAPSVNVPSVRVVGIIRRVTDIPRVDAPIDVTWIGDGFAFYTPAWFAAHGRQVANFYGLEVRLKRGTRDIGAFVRELARLTGGQATFHAGSDAVVGARTAERGTNLQAFALLLFGCLAALALVLVVGQAIARQIALGAEEFPILSALGFSRVQLFSLSVARASVVTIAGAALSIPVAIALSPLSPVGMARRAELHPGIAADWFVLGLGAAGMICMLMLASLWPAWRAAHRAAGTAVAHGPGVSRTAEALARAGMPPTAVSGVRLALEPGRGRSAVPVRSTLTASTAGLAALLAAVVFGLSLARVAGEPGRQGWTWDVAVGNPHSPDLADDILPKLRAMSAVEAVAGDALWDATIDGQSAGGAVGLRQVLGRVEPPVLAGRLPESPDEIALGGKLMRTLHKGIGDVVTVDGGEGSEAVMRVVGKIVLSPWAGNSQFEMGEAAVTTIDGMRRFAPEAAENMFLVRLRERDEATLAELRREFPGMVLPWVRAAEVQNLQGVSGMPLVLGLLLTLLAVATVAHTLVTSVRRRRLDLALLKTLGFLRAQVRWTIAWQASTLVVVALLAGIPLGTIAGRWAWIAYAHSSAILPEPVAPVGWFVLIVVPAGLVVANALAALPARAAARTQPAAVLRTK